MTAKYVDLDQFFAEQDEEQLTIKLYGQDWTLPASPPASAMLRVQRMAVLASEAKERLEGLSEDDDVPADLAELASFDLRAHASAVIGEENLQAWLDKGITQSQLNEAIRQVMQLHQGGGSPNRAARRKAGKSSDSPPKTS